MTLVAYNSYGVLDLANHDTTPGAIGPLAPPAGWEGDEKAYLNLMRRRYQDVGARQHLVFAARIRAGSPETVTVTGPYREAALKVLEAIGSSKPKKSIAATVPAEKHWQF